MYGRKGHRLPSFLALFHNVSKGAQAWDFSSSYFKPTSLARTPSFFPFFTSPPEHSRKKKHGRRSPLPSFLPCLPPPFETYLRPFFPSTEFTSALFSPPPSFLSSLFNRAALPFVFLCEKDFSRTPFSSPSFFPNPSFARSGSCFSPSSISMVAEPGAKKTLPFFSPLPSLVAFSPVGQFSFSPLSFHF